MNKSLISLAMDIIELDPEALENKDIITERLNAIGHKVESYIGLNNFCKSQISMIEEEIDRLEKHMKRFESLQESLKYKAENAMQALNVNELKSDLGHKIYIKETEAVDVLDSQAIPDQYMRKKITVEPDKAAIKSAIKAGEDVPGAALKKNKSIVFK